MKNASGHYFHIRKNIGVLKIALPNGNQNGILEVNIGNFKTTNGVDIGENIQKIIYTHNLHNYVNV